MFIQTVLTASLALTGVAAGDHHVRGDVVSATRVSHLSRSAAQTYLASFKTPVRNGIDTYRVTYRTITAQGRPTTASGVVVLPGSGSRSLRVVSYEHGTLVLKTDAPSTNGTTRPDRARTMIFGAAGYAAVAPDYLGMGSGPGHHPYTHAPTEVSASADLLRAARTLAATHHRRLESKVLVTGFSQGGHAAMALGKALQAGQVPHFGLRALAPISGPYDVRGVETPAGFDGRVDPQNAVFYFGYWLTSMNRVYHLYDKPSELFQEPYASKIEALFDGTHNETEIAKALPPTPTQLLTPAGVKRAEHPTGALLRAMRESDGTCAWKPRVPVQMYAASGDRNVPIQNARNCHAQIGTGKLIDLGAIDHTSTVHTALPQVLTWFDRL